MTMRFERWRKAEAENVRLTAENEQLKNDNADLYIAHGQA